MDDNNSIQGLAPSETPKEVAGHVSSSVKRWVSRIKAAEAYWNDDFERMRKNMEFAAGFQWTGQEKLDDDRYTANSTLRLVNQKVASLYARDPKMKAQRRRRMDFMLWDGRLESLTQSAALMTSPEADPAATLSALALQADYTRGRQQRDIIDRVGSTLEHVYQWQVENQTPTFKEQMKQLVRRTVITGVGYVRLHFSREHESVMTTSDIESTIADRMGRAKDIMRRLSSGELDPDSHEVMELAQLLQSVQSDSYEQGEIDERLIFDFPKSTEIIIDPRCHQLKGFVGARWVAQRYLMPIEEVNAFFGIDLKPGGELRLYNLHGRDDQSQEIPAEGDYTPSQCVLFWEVFDLSTKSCMIVADGHDDFLKPPEPVYPHLKNFWPIFPLTFNDIEVEPDRQKATIFPPSDVQLMKGAQKEWNRTREALRKHRRANYPKYATGKGWLTENDKEKLTCAEDNEVIEFEGAQPNEDINKKITTLDHAAIDPAVYDISPLMQDLLQTMGNENGTQPASTKATATAATINEQSRLVVTSSNVDDLDDFLCNIGEAASEILLREMQPETVKRIAGIGAVWPEGPSAEDFISYIFLRVEAASSGRPNKALEIANFQQLAPIMLQAGASPEFVLREAIKRLDDRLDIDEIFPYAGQQAMAMAQAQTQPQPSSGEPPRGNSSPTREGQSPSAAVPRPKTERPAL